MCARLLGLACSRRTVAATTVHTSRTFRCLFGRDATFTLWILGTAMQRHMSGSVAVCVALSFGARVKGSARFVLCKSAVSSGVSLKGPGWASKPERDTANFKKGPQDPATVMKSRKEGGYA